MSPRNSILEWHTLLDDSEWDSEESLDELLAARSPATALSTKSTNRLKRTLVGTALVAMLACGLILWFEAEKGIAAIEDELRATVAAEDWGRQSGDAGAIRALLDGEAEPEWRKRYLRGQETSNIASGSSVPLPQIEIDQTRLRPGRAMVHVTVRGQNTDAYRETRFYREEARGWVRTSPSSVFWGREQAQETIHFYIHYRQIDSQAVSEAARQLEKLYCELQFDLDLPDNVEKMTVEVAPLPVDELGFLYFKDDRLIVPSPMLLQIPVDAPESEILFQTIAYPLVVRMWEAKTQSEIAEEWRDGARLSWWLMLRGIQIWQAHADTELAARWYADSAAWLYRDGKALRVDQGLPSAVDQQSLCRESRVWQYNIPLGTSPVSICLDFERNMDSQHIAPPLTLNHLYTWEWDSAPSDRPYESWTRTVAAATVIEYLVETYGRGQLPLLVDGVRTHDRWETLIPDQLGITAQEFEAGWQGYLAEKYGHRDESPEP